MKRFIWLSILFLATGLVNTTTAAFRPTEKYLTPKPLSRTVTPLTGAISIWPAGMIKPSGSRVRSGLKGKLMSLMLKSGIVKKLAGIDEPTDRQKKLGRLSLIFGSIAVVLLLIPYVTLALPAVIGVLTVPAAIAGLVLGIKSTRGNTNVPGLLGLIISGSLLVLMILAVIFLALFFSEGWI